MRKLGIKNAYVLANGSAANLVHGKLTCNTGGRSRFGQGASVVFQEWIQQTSSLRQILQIDTRPLTVVFDFADAGRGKGVHEGNLDFCWNGGRSVLQPIPGCHFNDLNHWQILCSWRFGRVFIAGGFQSEETSVRFICQYVQHPVWALPNIPNALADTQCILSDHIAGLIKFDPSNVL